MGSIITFYSYKGGVGRSMALANIGAILAKWGKSTLLIDWDLEAPGLENYFKNLKIDSKKLDNLGLIDLLYKKIDLPSYNAKLIKWDDYLIPIEFENNQNLFLLASGKKDEKYISKVRELDFGVFYNKHDGGDFLEEIRTDLKKKFDFVLIDSRTGLTDSSGVCSIHMPDKIVILFTATEQGFKGTLDVVNKSKEKQQDLIYDRLKLKVLPVPTRFDNSELSLTEEWLGKFANDLTAVYSDLISKDKEGNLTIQPIDVLKRTKIPYIPFYSYGEKLPVIEQGGDDPNSIGYVYETIAAILSNDFMDIHMLKDERDSYLKKGKGEELIDFTYYQNKIEEERLAKKKLEDELSKIKMEVEINAKKELEFKQQQVLKSNKIKKYTIGITIFLALIALIIFLNSRNRETKTEYMLDDTAKLMIDSGQFFADSTKIRAYDTSAKMERYDTESLKMKK